MSVGAARHFIDDTVRAHIKSKGMLFYTSMMKMYIESFEDLNLTVKQRIEKVSNFLNIFSNFKILYYFSNKFKKAVLLKYELSVTFVFFYKKK